MSDTPSSPHFSAKDLLGFGLINEASISAARTKSVEYLEAHPELVETLEACVFAGRAMADLYPERAHTFFSGHTFPVMQAQHELETSIQFALEGFYTYAFVALRTVLELELVGVFFAVDDEAHTEIQTWLRSQERTPAMARMLTRIFTLPALAEADQELELRRRIRDLYDELGGYVHTRGYRFSSQRLNRTNINAFNEQAFLAYIAEAEKVIGLSAAVLAGKYLVGLQSLPLDAKFGMNGPAGGLLDWGTAWLQEVIPDDLLALLQRLSDEDEETQAIVDWVNGMPDLTEEQLKEQSEEWERTWGAHLKNPEEAEQMRKEAIEQARAQLEAAQQEAAQHEAAHQDDA